MGGMQQDLPLRWGSASGSDSGKQLWKCGGGEEVSAVLSLELVATGGTGRRGGGGGFSARPEVLGKQMRRVRSRGVLSRVEHGSAYLSREDR
jgi:hypothetical protein